jgi:hypothetical protein
LFCFVERRRNYLSNSASYLIQDNLEKSSPNIDEAFEDGFNYYPNTTLTQSAICSEIKEIVSSTKAENENLLEETNNKLGLDF